VIARPLPSASDAKTLATPRQAATPSFHILFSSLFILALHHSTVFAIRVVLERKLVAQKPARTCIVCALSFTFGREVRNTLAKTTTFPRRFTS
jgi:hypothetical protein